MTVLEHPSFDPAYVPMNGKPDSILIQCHNETQNVFTYQAWDEVSRWFAINRPDGSVETLQEFTYGETYVIPNEPGWSVDYYSGGIYHYGVVPGQCSEQTTATTTTAPPVTTTTPTTEQSTTSTTLSTPTTELVESTTTSPTVPSETTLVTVQGTVTSLVPLTEVVKTPTTSRQELAATGFGLMSLVFLALLLIAVGTVVFAAIKLRMTRETTDPQDSLWTKIETS